MFLMMHKEKLSERIHIGVPIPRPYPARASFHSSGPMDDPPKAMFLDLSLPWNYLLFAFYFRWNW